MQNGSIVVSGSGSVTGKYKTQYFLTMLVLTSGAGTTLPGSGLRDAGSKLNISAIVTPQYLFRFWLGIGIGSYTGNKNPSSIMMNGTITEIPVMAKKKTR